jgi:hypothetical protein
VAVLALDDVLPAVAQILATAALDGGPPVHIDYPDSLDPPAVVVIWDDPWLDEPTTITGCVLPGHVAAIAFAGRVEAGPGVEVLQDLVAGVITAMRGSPFALAGVGAPRQYDVAGITYLGARVALRVPVAI